MLSQTGLKRGRKGIGGAGLEESGGRNEVLVLVRRGCYAIDVSTNLARHITINSLDNDSLHTSRNSHISASPINWC